MELDEYAGEIKVTIQVLESINLNEAEEEIKIIQERISSWESVTVGGVTIKTDHRWLSSQLDSISKEQNSEKRQKTLNRLIKKLNQNQQVLKQ